VPSITLRKSVTNVKPGTQAKAEVGKTVAPIGGTATTTINSGNTPTVYAAQPASSASGKYVVELPSLGLKQTIASAVSAEDAWQQFALNNGILASEDQAVILQL
jgi:hypothetical protein